MGGDYYGTGGLARASSFNVAGFKGCRRYGSRVTLPETKMEPEKKFLVRRLKSFKKKGGLVRWCSSSGALCACTIQDPPGPFVIDDRGSL